MRTRGTYLIKVIRTDINYVFGWVREASKVCRVGETSTDFTNLNSYGSSAIFLYNNTLSIVLSQLHTGFVARIGKKY